MTILFFIFCVSALILCNFLGNKKDITMTDLGHNTYLQIQQYTSFGKKYHISTYYSKNADNILVMSNLTGPAYVLMVNGIVKKEYYVINNVQYDASVFAGLANQRFNFKFE